MALPAAQGGGNAGDVAALRQAELAPRRHAVARRIAGKVDAGRHRADLVGVQLQVADQVAAQAFAGGDDVGRGAAVEPARRGIAAHRRRDVADPHHRRRAVPEAGGQGHQPAVGGTVADDQVRRQGPQAAAQGAQAGHPFAADGDGLDRDAAPLRLAEDARFRRTQQQHAVAARDHAGHFGEHPDFLPAPAQRGLGMDHEQPIHTASSSRSYCRRCRRA